MFKGIRPGLILPAAIAFMAMAPALRAGEKDTLVVAMSNDARNLDPHLTNDVYSAQVMVNLYQNLLTLDTNNNIVGQLAANVKRINDRTYSFSLKKGVKFHNGETLKASDVKFSLERAATVSGSAVTQVVSEIAKIDTPDDYTVVVTLKHTFTPFLTYLTHVGGGSILNKKAVMEAGAAYGQHPVGTGPFRFSKWVRNDSIVLDAFDGFQGPRSAEKRILFRVIPESNSRSIELESGGVDVALQVLATDVDKLSGNAKLHILRVPALSTQYLGFNCARKPFDDVRVRQAIGEALDVPAIVKAVYRGIGSAAAGPLPPGMQFADKSLTVRPRNLAKARQLLAAAGVRPGLRVNLWTTDRKDRIDMATIIQNQLKDVGLDVNISIMDFNAFATGAIKSQHEMFIIGFAPSTPDPDNGLFPVFHSSQRGTTNNLSNFSVPEIDKLLEQGREMPDSAKRRDLYFNLQRQIVDKRPWVPLYYPDVIVGSQKNVASVAASSLDMELLYNARKQ